MSKVISFVYHICISIVETLLRLAPFATKTGLRTLGSPNRSSPVFLTCNFNLTVSRVKRALKGVDCYLLVANTKGINVWCAATGGHLSNHSVISVIKTSGIEDKIDHKIIILPQLAAAGVEPKVIKQKTSWTIVWGPVDVKDVKEFIKLSDEKTEQMRKVNFPWYHRIEMAAMWAFPISIILTIIWLSAFLNETVAMLIQVWAISIITFLLFPLYEPLLKYSNQSKKTSHLYLIKVALVIFLSSIALLGVVIYTMIITDYEPWKFIRWCIFSFLVVLMLVLDLAGTSPTFKSDTHAERVFEVKVDNDKCRGTGICIDVCPRNCYELNEEHTKIIPIRMDDCVQCSACIVQCPFDALYFENTKGTQILAEAVRKFKLNLSGKREIKEEN